MKRLANAVKTALIGLGKTIVFIVLGLLWCVAKGLQWGLMIGSVGVWFASMWFVVERMYWLYVPSTVNDLHAVSCALAFVSLIIFVPFAVFKVNQKYVFGGFWFGGILGLGVVQLTEYIQDVLLVSVPVFSLGALLIVTMVRFKRRQNG